jgi:hypothetical protein
MLEFILIITEYHYTICIYTICLLENILEVRRKISRFLYYKPVITVEEESN